jgi:acetoacetyl-CoA synthetase
MNSTARPSSLTPAWQPTTDRISRSNLARFATWVQDRTGVPVTESYEHLWQWSVDDIGGFWLAVWDFFGVQADGSPFPALQGHSMPEARWFPDTRLNYAEHVLRDRNKDALAIQFATEDDRGVASWTWARLEDETARIAAGLRRLGVGRGDRVAAYLTNTPETVAALLACASLGAIWSAAPPEFGGRTVIDRFGQIEPKVLLAVDGYRYGGREFDRREVIGELRDGLSSVEHIVVHERLGLGAIPDTIGWDELTAVHEPLKWARVPFDHPLWILYSSGTTGLPKGIVHGHGGILLEHLKTAHLHFDAQAGDRVFWFTTTGWMMWNLLVGILLTPASIVLYDGNPATPTLDRLWDLAEQTEMTMFGTSASYIAACMGAGTAPRAGGRNLTKLTAVGSTGSPLSPEGFRWVYDNVGSDTWLFSTSGGTDVCTAFVGGVPTLPVYLGELQARALGAEIEAWDADGHSLVGAVGELVITQPMPSMPVSFWGDADGSRYRSAYFEHFPGVWRHGDWIEITQRGTAIISGRSDATINRGGIRIGTSEIYRAVLAEETVVDALAVDLPLAGTEGWMPLFVVLSEGKTVDVELADRIKRRIRRDCSPRHVPDEIIQISEVPRTLSGKATEVPVKRILMGEPVERAVSRDALANPHALEPFIALAGRVRLHPKPSSADVGSDSQTNESASGG